MVLWSDSVKKFQNCNICQSNNIRNCLIYIQYSTVSIPRNPPAAWYQIATWYRASQKWTVATVSVTEQWSSHRVWPAQKRRAPMRPSKRPDPGRFFKCITWFPLSKLLDYFLTHDNSQNGKIGILTWVGLQSTERVRIPEEKKPCTPHFYKDFQIAKFLRIKLFPDTADIDTGV